MLHVGGPSHLLCGVRGDRPPRAARHGLAPGLGVVHSRAEQPGERGTDQQMVEPACGVLVDPVPLLAVEHRAVVLVEHAARARVDHDQARPAEVAAVAPARAVGVAVRPEGELLQELLGVVLLLHAAQELVVLVRLRREVPQVLVDPVRRQRTLDVLVPPVVLTGLVEPRLGDVPVVVDVVVVEDHHRRHRGEQPADGRVAPALEVELRVLLEVEHAVAGRLRQVAPGLDERARGRGDLVGVDLVAEHEQHVGPVLARLVAHAHGERVQRVDLAAALVLVLLQRIGRLVRRRHAAGAEHDPERAVLRIGVEGARRPAVVARPDALAVEEHLVLVPAAWLEVAAADERVVVPGDAEGALAGAEDLHLAGRVGLDPEDGIGLADVSEHGSED